MLARLAFTSVGTYTHVSFSPIRHQSAPSGSLLVELHLLNLLYSPYPARCAAVQLLAHLGLCRSRLSACYGDGRRQLQAERMAPTGNRAGTHPKIKLAHVQVHPALAWNRVLFAEE